MAFSHKQILIELVFSYEGLEDNLIGKNKPKSYWSVPSYLNNNVWKIKFKQSHPSWPYQTLITNEKSYANVVKSTEVPSMQRPSTSSQDATVVKSTEVSSMQRHLIKKTKIIKTKFRILKNLKHRKMKQMMISFTKKIKKGKT